MQLPTATVTALLLPLLLLLLLTGLATAWELDLSYDDNTSMKLHGHTNSHCKRFKKTNAGIDNAYFDSSALADTFELYRDNRCKDLVYKGKKGSHPVPDNIYRSYKVY